MKKHRLFLFTILLMVLAWPQSLRAYDFSAVAPTGQTLYYNIVSGWVEVTYPGTSSDIWGGYTKPAGVLTIPSTVTYSGNTYSVRRIGTAAFKSCTGLTSVTIPNSVVVFLDQVFSGCTSLTSVAIPNSVTYISSYAFYGCTGLTSITIPNSVTYIHYNAFYGCTGLTSVTIPNSVTTISVGAFYGCSGLTSITIPNSVTTIGSSAFSGCTGLTSVTIGNSVTSIGDNAFYGCSGLTSVTIPIVLIPSAIGPSKTVEILWSIFLTQLLQLGAMLFIMS